MTTSASLPSALSALMPTAAPARAGTPGASDQGPSFSDMLADQSAPRQKPAAPTADTKPTRPGKSSEHPPAKAEPSKPAQSADAAPPSGSADGKPVDNKADSDADTAAEADPASAQAAVPAPTLPQQALEIAAQVAAVQGQVAAKEAAQAQAAPVEGAEGGVAAGAQQRAPVLPLPAQPAPVQQAGSGQADAATAPAQPLPADSAQVVASDPANAQVMALRAQAPAPAPAGVVPPAAKMGASHRAASGQHGAAQQPLPQEPAAQAPQPQDPTVAAANTAPAPVPHTADANDASALLAALRQTPQASATAASTAASDNRPAAPGLPLLEVTSPVGSAQWGTDLGRQLVILGRDTSRGHQTAELRLDPPDLGPLRVTLTLADGVASASFVSAHAAVRQALEASMPQLQQALANAGISLGQTSVGEQGAQMGQEFASGQQQRQHQGQAAAGDGSGGVVAGQAARTVVRDANALVDTFA